MEMFKASEVFETAIRIEQNGKKFYRHFASSSENEHVKHTFDYLADEEEKHESTFKQMLSEFEKYEPRESYPGEFYDYMRAYADGIIFDEEKLNKQIEMATDIELAIDFGIDREIKSIVYYSEIKKFVPENQRERIEKLINEVNPQRIYTHSVKDTHQDHRNVAYATLAAARNVSEIFLYESPSLYLDFKPNYYVDVSDFIDEKLRILNLFASQNGKDYMKIEAIKGLAKFRGLATFINYAEAFEIFRVLKKKGV